MFSVVAKDLFRGRLIRCDTRDAIDDLLAQLAGFFVDRFSMDHEGLAHMGKVQVVIEFFCYPDFPCFDPPMLAITGVREIGCSWRVLKVVSDVFKEVLLVLLDGKVVVRVPFLYQVFSQLNLGKEGICGNRPAFDLNAVKHRRRDLDLIGLFFFITAF